MVRTYCYRMIEHFLSDKLPLNDMTFTGEVAESHKRVRCTLTRLRKEFLLSQKGKLAVLKGADLYGAIRFSFWHREADHRGLRRIADWVALRRRTAFHEPQSSRRTRSPWFLVRHDIPLLRRISTVC